MENSDTGFAKDRRDSTPLIVAGEPVTQENNIRYMHSRRATNQENPALSRDEIMRKIGAKIIPIKRYDDGRIEYTHNPISMSIEADGSVTVLFEKYETGYDASRVGLQHLNGKQGTETRSVVASRFDALTHEIVTQSVHQRNYRYILIGYEARKHAGKAEAESRLINYDLWHKPLLANAAD